MKYHSCPHCGSNSIRKGQGCGQAMSNVAALLLLLSIVGIPFALMIKPKGSYICKDCGFRWSD